MRADRETLAIILNKADGHPCARSLITKFTRECQIVLFSATFVESVRNFAIRFAPSANEIKLKQEELSLDAIKQFFMGEQPDAGSIAARG